jgi:uncharacterized protein YjeT (DUF2065 family)
MWNDLLSALALMLVLEGLLPFISPKGFREKMLVMLQMNDSQIRFASLTAMLLGVVLLYIVRN